MVIISLKAGIINELVKDVNMQGKKYHRQLNDDGLND